MHKVYLALLVFITIIGILAPSLFTAVQMGAFSSEPVLDTQPMTTSPNAPVLRIATDYDFCPNSYYNKKGDLSGLYIEIITEAANRLGMRLEFKTGEWLKCREMLENGDADVLLGLEIFSNMEGTLRTIPMCSDQLCVYGKKTLNSAAGLAGKRVALMARSVIETTYDLQCEYVEYYTNTEILEAVENGDVDYGICHAAVAAKIIDRNDFNLKKGVAIANSFPAMAVDDSRPELKEKLNTVLQEMSMDGTIGHLKTKWLANFTKDRSFSYVLQHNQLFYVTFFLGLAVAYLICISGEIMDRRQAEYIQSLLSYQKQLKASNEEATRANRAKSEFLSHMSHDIRTPINGIMGMADRIRKNETDPAVIDTCLQKIDGASAHLLSLLNDVLDMSELEHGTVHLEHQPFDLETELTSVQSLADDLANPKHTVFSLSSEVTHRYLLGSPLHLRRILLNLISNAKKYNKEGGRIDVSAKEISCSETQAEFIFQVSDTGIGMSPEFVQNDLFQPFMQENDSVRTVYQGTGLGMSIVHHLVEIMNGSISVESEPGVGTTFTVQLTFDLDPAPEVSHPAEPETLDDISGMRVLVVEDNDLNLEIAQYMLADDGVETATAVNGQIAVELFRSSEPGTFDAILMDIMMPVMDGMTAAKTIRALPREDAKTIPIIAMTANAFDEDREKTLASGMNAYLTKPVDARELHRVLAKYKK
ncbi:ATP-binding protein [Fusicatenibacter sp.]